MTVIEQLTVHLDEHRRTGKTIRTTYTVTGSSYDTAETQRVHATYHGTVSMEIDVPAIFQRIARHALTGKTGRAQTLCGLIKVRQPEPAGAL